MVRRFTLIDQETPLPLQCVLPFVDGILSKTLINIPNLGFDKKVTMFINRQKDHPT